MVRFGRCVLETEIVRIQKLIRFSFSLLELACRRQPDRSKYRANTLDVRMLAPDRLRQRLHQNFPQSVVRSAPDAIQQTGYPQSGRCTANRRQLVFDSSVRVLQFEDESVTGRHV